MTSDDLRYPLGRFTYEAPLSPSNRGRAIGEIAALPAALRGAVSGLGDAQLDTPYREGGWTVRQVVHHVADSHVNGYVRFRRALTEENPAICPYDQAGWAALPDARKLPIGVSLDLLDALHMRWAHLLARMTDDDFARTFFHPVQGETLTLDYAVALYAWHGQHHMAHITALRVREGWV